MQTLFSAAMRPRMPIEQHDLLREAIGLFEEVGFTAPFEPLQEIIEVGVAQTDTDGVVGQVYSIIDDALVLLLQSYGVVVNLETELNIKLTIAKVISGLDSYYLPDDILAIIESVDDAEVVLAEIVSLTALVSPEAVLDHVASVEPKLIELVRSILVERRDYDAVFEPEVTRLETKDHIQTLNRLLKDPGNEQLLIVPALLEAGVRIGTLNPTDLINQHIEELTLIPMESLARTLFAIVVFSKVPKAQWIAQTRELFMEFTDLMSDIRVADRYLESQKALLA